MTTQGNQAALPVAENELAQTVMAIRPMVPAKDFATSRRFYEELGFRPEALADGLVEMHLGEYSFILQDYYVEQWASNLVFHMRVSDVNLWWNRIVSLKLAERYGVRAKPPHPAARLNGAISSIRRAFGHCAGEQPTISCRTIGPRP